MGLALLLANWIWAVARFQANGLYWDQWGLHLAQILDQGPWSIFTWQHGPHRQGIGGILTAMVMEATQGDTRAESLWIVGQLLVATVLAISLVVRIKGRLAWVDFWVPLSMFALSRYETVILVPNGSHSVTPLLLILVGAHCWSADRTAIRHGGLALVGGCLIFTGFGNIAAFTLTLVVAWQLAIAGPGFSSRRERLAGAGLLLALLLFWALFLHDYVFVTANDEFSFLHLPVIDYAKFGLLLAAGLGGRESIDGVSYVLGVGVLGYVTIVLIRWLMYRREQPPSSHGPMVLWLVATGIGFMAFTSHGRVSLGLQTAMASRYTVLTWLVLLGGYLLSMGMGARRSTRMGITLGWIVAIGPWVHLWDRPVADWRGTLGMRDGDLATLRQMVHRKVAWQFALRESNQWRAAEERVPFGVFPSPEAMGFDELLPRMEQSGFGFSLGKSDDLSWLPWSVDHPVQWIHPLSTGSWRSAEAEARVLVRNARHRFLNVRFQSMGKELERWHWGWGAQHGPVLAAPGSEMGISVPVPVGDWIIKADGAVRLQTPVLSNEPHFSTWHWNVDAWCVDRLLVLQDGFHGWENNGQFGWSDAFLRGEVTVNHRSFLNLWIESRFDPVDTGPVCLSLGGWRQEFEIPKEGDFRISLGLSCSGGAMPMSLANVAGAMSPHDMNWWNDDRKLALRLRRISLDSDPAFKRVIEVELETP